MYEGVTEPVCVSLIAQDYCSGREVQYIDPVVAQVANRVQNVIGTQAAFSWSNAHSLRTAAQML